MHLRKDNQRFKQLEIKHSGQEDLRILHETMLSKSSHGVIKFCYQTSTTLKTKHDLHLPPQDALDFPKHGLGKFLIA